MADMQEKNEQQEQRGTHLRNLMESYHRSKFGDYDDTYEQFARAYFGEEGLEEEYEGELEELERKFMEAGGRGIEMADRLDELRGIEPEELIPKYASLAGDETYGMISCFDDIKGALEHQSIIPNSGDTLNVPYGIVDLDTGNNIEIRRVTLTLDTYRALCGIVAPTEGKDVTEGGDAVTNHDGIFCDWDELRSQFPIEEFKILIEGDLDRTTYDPEFGY